MFESACRTFWEKVLPFIGHSLVPTLVILLAIFLPLVPFTGDWNPDIVFVLWLLISYTILVIREHFGCMPPAYWSSTLLAGCSLPWFYGGIPTLLKHTPLLSVLRAWHVGLLTSRSGYATDITLFKKNKLLTVILVSSSLIIDMSVTFVVMRHLSFSLEASILMAAISPAPSPEVALPLFEHMTSCCKPKKKDLETETEADTETKAKLLRLEKYRTELADTLSAFKTTALPLILITIGGFCAIASGVDLKPASGNEVLAVHVDWGEVGLNAIYGILAALPSSGVLYLVGLTAAAKGISSGTLAPTLVSFASLSMVYFGNYVPVASALAAIGGCLALREVMGHDEQTSAILSKFWPYTSHLYYSTFVYGVVGYYVKNGDFLGICWWKVLVGSLVPFLIKFVALTFLTRQFKRSWPSSLTLALSLCSKGTVQIALSPIILFKIETVEVGSRVLTDVASLQLFVLINYVSILLLIYIVTWITAICLRR